MKILIRLVIVAAFLGLHTVANATHNRAGEILIEQTGPLTIRATIITYTKASSIGADRAELELHWGDGSSDTVRRSNGGGIGEFLPGDIKRNIYIGTHTYLGRSTYRVWMEDPNRNGGILNVNFPNSEAVPFYIQTTFSFLNSTFNGFNSTPRLLQPPVDKGCVGKTFIHSLNAFDPDGDSLAFRLAVPLQGVGVPVPLYDFPDRIRPGANNTIFLNERTGQFVWQAPQLKGEYNIAFQIISYRRGTDGRAVAIDTTVRDMQVFIDDCQNDPPRITTIDEICVAAGRLISFPVRATDPNVGQRVNLTALGGPFEVKVSRATFRGSGGFQLPPVVDTFRWQTTCEHIDNFPYTVVFKASDNFFDSTGLVDLKTVRIKVVGPSPEDVRVATNSGTTEVSWRRPYICEGAADRYFFGFSVWRREGSNPLTIDTCSPGLDGRGYTRVAFDTIFSVVNGRYQYVDRNVERGKTYCYRILAHFAKRTTANLPYNLVESLPSAEACIQLQRDIPLLTKVSVTETSNTTGAMRVEWTRPVAADLDTVRNPGPYRFVLSRSTGIGTSTFQPVAGATFTSNAFWQLRDTVFNDVNLNTVQNGYTYRVAFFVRNDSLMGNSQPASSHFLTIRSSDRINTLSWQQQVPWTNSRYDIFRLNRTTGVFDSIGTTTAAPYVDRNLVNRTEYCYYIRAVGSYGINGVPTPLVNLSQRVCATPIDTVPPCPPNLAVSNLCDSTGQVSNIINNLRWTNPRNNCVGSEDVVRYNVYFTDTEGGQFQRIATINNARDTIFAHQNANGSVAGCYYVTSIDSVGNESAASNQICVDNCPYFELPNAFTPNGDGDNEKFKARRIRFIDKIDLKVYNRWGQLVYQTDDPRFEWDGKNLQGNDLAQGTYFYTCIVYELRVKGVVPAAKPLSGYIELVRN